MASRTAAARSNPRSRVCARRASLLYLIGTLAPCIRRGRRGRRGRPTFGERPALPEALQEVLEPGKAQGGLVQPLAVEGLAEAPAGVDAAEGPEPGVAARGGPRRVCARQESLLAHAARDVAPAQSSGVRRYCARETNRQREGGERGRGGDGGRERFSQGPKGDRGSPDRHQWKSLAGTPATHPCLSKYGSEGGVVGRRGEKRKGGEGGPRCSPAREEGRLDALEEDLVVRARARAAAERHRQLHEVRVLRDPLVRLPGACSPKNQSVNQSVSQSVSQSISQVVGDPSSSSSCYLATGQGKAGYSGAVSWLMTVTITPSTKAIRSNRNRITQNQAR